jgi:hypothetical protein
MRNRKRRKTENDPLFFLQPAGAGVAIFTLRLKRFVQTDTGNIL